MSLMPVAEAQARLLALAAPLPVGMVPLAEACGRWLAASVAALRDQPWADLSAMDGYAIRFADMPGPWSMEGESRAGGEPPSAPLLQGEAMRIFTGAPLPGGADCVLVQEDCAVAGERLILTGDGPGGVGRHIRPRGSDFAAGDPMLAEGIAIGPRQMALAAVAGHGTLPVCRRPRIAVLSSGDELVRPGAPVPPGKLPASNDVMLAAMLAEAGCETLDIGLVPDRIDALVDALGRAADCDIIVSTGGASVGDHDLIRPALLEAGGSIDFWKIAMRPGKPLIAGRLGQAIMLGLPGNPVSAFVTAQLFLLPLVRRMMGAPDPLPRRHQVPSAIPLPAGGSRAEYRRVIVADGTLTDLLDRDSGALRPLSLANALLERPVDAAPVKAGDSVTVMMLENA